MALRRYRKVGDPLKGKRCTYLEALLSSIPEGRVTVISYLRELAIESEPYKNLIREYDKDPKADLGELCEQFHIQPADLLADVNRAAYPVLEEANKLARGIAQGVVNQRLAKVVERGMLEASKKDGVADRHFTLQREGFHIAPKGVSISMNQVNATAAGIPSFEDETKELSDILTVDGEVINDLQLSEGESDYVECEEEEELQEA